MPTSRKIIGSLPVTGPVTVTMDSGEVITIPNVKELRVFRVENPETTMPTYEGVLEGGIWLEDAGRGQFSRYNYPPESEESVWLCHECCSVVDEPDEHECDE